MIEECEASACICKMLRRVSEAGGSDDAADSAKRARSLRSHSDRCRVIDKCCEVHASCEIRTQRCANCPLSNSAANESIPSFVVIEPQACMQREDSRARTLHGSPNFRWLETLNHGRAGPWSYVSRDGVDPRRHCDAHKLC